MADPQATNEETDYAAMMREAKTAAADAPAPGETDYTKLKTDINFQTPRFDLKAQFDAELEPVIKDFSRHYSNANKAINSGYLYSDYIKGNKTLEQVRAAEEGADDSPDLTDWGKNLGGLVEVLPSIADYGKQFALGFAAAAPAGVAIGLTAAAPTAEMAAPVTVPTAIMGTGMVGGPLWAANAGAEVAAGNLVKDMLKEGVDPVKAKMIATTGGAFIGFLNLFGAGVMGKQVMALAGKGGRPAVEHWVVSHFKNSGIIMLDLDAQHLVNEFSKSFSRLSSGIEDKDLPGRVVKGFVQNIPLALGLGALSTAAGKMFQGKAPKTGEATAGPVEPHVDLNSPADILRAITEVLKGEPISHNHQWGKVSLKDKVHDKIAEIKDAIADVELSKAEIKAGKTLSPADEAKLAVLKFDLEDARAERKQMASDKKAADLKDMKSEQKKAANLEDELVNKIAKLEDIRNNAEHRVEVIKGRLSAAKQNVKDLAAEIADAAKNKKDAAKAKASHEKEAARVKELGRVLTGAKEDALTAKVAAEELTPHLKAANLEARLLAEKIAKIEKSALKSGVKNLIEQLERRLPQGTGSNKRSPFPPGDSRALTLNAYAKFLNDKEAAVKAVQDYAEANANKPQSKDLLEGHIVDDEMLEARVQAEQAQEVLNLSDGASYDKLANKIKGIVDGARKDRRTQLAEKSAIRKANRRTAEEYAQGNKPVGTGEEGHISQAEAKFSELNPIHQFLRDMGGGTANGKVMQIAQDHPDMPAFVKMMDPAQYLNPVLDNIDEQTKKLFGHLEDAIGGGKADLLKINHQLNSHTFTIGKKKFTGGEALDAILRWEDLETRKGMEVGNKLTQADIDVISDKLAEIDPRILKLVEGYQKFYQEYGPRLAKFFKDDTGLDLPISNPKYGGKARRIGVGGKIEPEQDLAVGMSNAAKSHSLTVGRTASTITRVKDSPLEVHLQNPLHTAMAAIDSAERYGGFNEVSKQLYAPILTNPDFKAIVTAKNGVFAFDAYAGQIRDVLGKSELDAGQWSKRMGDWMRGTGTAHLGLNPLGYAKQAFGVVNFLLEMPHDVLSAGYRDYFKDMKAANAILMQSPILQRRYADFLKTQLGASTTKTLQDSKFDKVNDFLMLPLKLGDQAASMPGAWAAYKHFTSEAGGSLSKAEALEKAAMIVENTQASGRPDIQSNFSRNGATKLFALFSQPVQRQFEYEVQAWRRHINFPSLENLKKAVTASAVTRASQALFVGVNAAYISGLKQFGLKSQQDEDNAVWEMARPVNPLSQLATLPIVGAVASPVVVLMEQKASQLANQATGGAVHESKNRAYPAKPILWSSLESTAKMGKDVDAMTREGLTLSNFADLVTHYSDSIINSMAGGLPLARVSKPVKDIAEKQSTPLQSGGSGGDNSAYLK